MSISAQLKTNSRTFLNEYLNQNQSSYRQKSSVTSNKITFNSNSFKAAYKKGLTLNTNITTESNSDYNSIHKYEISFDNMASKSPDVPTATLDDRYNYAFSRAFEPTSNNKKRSKQSNYSNKSSSGDIMLRKLFFSPNKSGSKPSSIIFENIENKRGVQSNRTLKVDTDILHSSSNAKRESNNSQQPHAKSALLNTTWANSLSIQPVSAQGPKPSLISFQSLFPRQAEPSPDKESSSLRLKREVLIKTYNPGKSKPRPHSSSQKVLLQTKSSSQLDFESIVKDNKRTSQSPDTEYSSNYEDKRLQYKLKRNAEGSFELAAPSDTFNKILRENAKVSSQQLTEIQSSLKGIPMPTTATQKSRKAKRPSREGRGKPFINIIENQQPQQEASPGLSDLVSNNSKISSLLIKSNVA